MVKIIHEGRKVNITKIQGDHQGQINDFRNTKEGAMINQARITDDVYWYSLGGELMKTVPS